MSIDIAMVGDFGKDLDDENALLYAVGAQRSGEAELVAVVANLDPVENRARLAQGMLRVLGVQMEVGMGTDCNQIDHTQPYETDVPYLAIGYQFRDGMDVLGEALESSPDYGLSLVLNSGLTDAARLFEAEPYLARRKLAQVAIMGGVATDGEAILLNEYGRMIPDSAANNLFDPAASTFAYDWLQANQVPLSVLTREAAYACKFEFAFYEQLAATGNPVGQAMYEREAAREHNIGEAIRNRQEPALNELWRVANLPVGTPERGALPDRCDRAWFVQTYLNGADPGEVQEIWPLALDVGTFQLYDSLNVASVVRPDLFDPAYVTVHDTTHRIIGVSARRYGIRDVAALRDHVASRELTALG